MRFYREFVFYWFFFVLLCFLVLPANSIYGVPIKAIGALILLMLMGVFFTAGSRFNFSNLLFLVVFVFFIMYGSVVSFYKEVFFYSFLSHISALLSWFLPIFFGAFLVDFRVVRKDHIINFFINIAIFLAAVKVFINASVFLGVFYFEDYVNIQFALFGNTPISLDAGAFYRLNYSSDFILLPAIFSLLHRYIRKTDSKTMLKILLLFSSVVISYSRYLWAASFLAVIIFLILSKKGRWLLFSGSCVVLCCSVFFFDKLIGFISERYFGRNADYSDSFREVMFVNLVEGISENPLLGLGIGGFVDELVRFEESPWNYELQFLSFVLHYGVIGSGLIFVFFFLFVRSVFYDSVSCLSYFFLWLVFFVLFVSVGFFNCFLLTSASGCVFLFFWALSSRNDLLASNGDY